MGKIKKQQGQILLVAIMILSTVITVVLSSSFKSTTETQLTKLEEENQKTLSAAQTALEAALKRGGNITNLNEIGLSGFTGGATISNNTSNNFTTPPLQKDEQYTFYLSNYDEANNSFSTFWGGNLTICFSTEAIELTLIDNTNSVANKIYSEGSSGCPNNSAFSKYYIININNTKLLIARLINSSITSSRIAFYGTNSFPLQGKRITSNVTSPGGVNKKIELFQTYPQIPAEFFVTAF